MFVTDATGTPPRRVSRGFHLHLSKSGIAIIGVFLLAPWVFIFVRSGLRPHVDSVAQAQPATAPVVAASATSQKPSATGPWGELDVTPITIEAPADAAIRFAQADTSTWYFADCTAEKLAAILKSAGLTDTQREAILRLAVSDPSINGMRVKADSGTIVSLSYEARTALYQVLSEDSRNPQAEPFRRRPNPANDWFAEIGLSEETASMARKLVYRRGEMEAFADVSAIVPTLHTDTERAQLFRALSSQAVLLVQLRITPQTDLRALIDYWGKGDRQREVGPLLESLSKVPGGDEINVAQLLPQFARSRIYTYPEPTGTTANGPLDCHWTSLNFWNSIPDNRFSNPNNVREQLGREYRQVEKPTQLGDVIFLLDQKGQGIHSATYVADDIVFTKNGTSVAAPWVLMRLPNLLSYYENADVVKTLVFRKNGL
jgi:hypothetical protein